MTRKNERSICKTIKSGHPDEIQQFELPELIILADNREFTNCEYVSLKLASKHPGFTQEQQADLIALTVIIDELKAKFIERNKFNG